MVKVFIIGATGYIGGDVLYALSQAHPEYEITALVRNSDKGAIVAKEHPSVRLVYGDLDSSELISEEVAKADIVFQAANCDHEGLAHAIVKGLSSAATASNQKFYIHISGTGILTQDDISERVFGKLREKVYDDWKDVNGVTEQMRDDAMHRNVDKIVIAGGESEGIKTAVVCPPCISGPGRGPANKRSIQAYELAKATINLGYGIDVNGGQNRWSEVHVQDLTDAVVRLFEEAALGGGKAVWGPEGYYFTESGEVIWGDVSKAIAREAKKQGLIETDEVKSLSSEEIKKVHPWGPIIWGSNSRSRAIRARKILGWEPKQKNLFELIPDIVADEAKALGKIPAHREVAAGDA